MLRRLRSIGLFALLGLAVALAATGCDGCGKSHPGAKPLPPLGPGETRLQEPKRPPRPVLSEIVHTTTSIDFTIRGDAALFTAGDEIAPFIFCIPEGRPQKIFVTEYDAGGTFSFTQAPPQDVSALATPKPSPSGNPEERRRTEAREKISGAVRIEQLGIMRRWNLGAVYFNHDFVPDSVKTGEIRARVSIRWKAPAELTKSPPFERELDPKWGWGRVAASLVSNPEGLRFFQLERPPLDEGITTEPPELRRQGSGNGPWAKFSLEAEGLHLLDLAKLVEAGLVGATADPSGLRVFHQGKPYPLFRRGEEKLQAVYLWNEAQSSPYTAQRTFWITEGKGGSDPAIEAFAQSDLKTAPRDVGITTRTAKVEKDNKLLISYGIFREILSMEWAQEPLTGERGIELPFVLESLVTPPAALDVKLEFLWDSPEEGAGAPNLAGVKALLKQGGRVVGEAPIQTATSFSVGIPVAPGDLREGENRFTLTLEQPAGRPPLRDLWFDRATLEYPSAARLTAGRLSLADADAPTTETYRWKFLDSEKGAMALTVKTRKDTPGEEVVEAVRRAGDGAGEFLWQGGPGRRVEVYDPGVIPVVTAFERAAPVAAAELGSGADYLILAHADFLEGIKPLAEFRQKQGLRVLTLDIQQVYAAFSGGEPSPLAIRDFLAWTMSHWKEGAPTYVLLVGDCSSDYRGFMRTGVRNYIPSTTQTHGKDRFASDEWLGNVTPRDLLGDFMIGRLSVNNAGDLAAIVKKTIEYADSFRPGPWRARLGWIADTDPEFPAMLDEIQAQTVPAALEPRRVYQRDLPAEDNRYAADAYREAVYRRDKEWMKVTPAATQKIFELFKEGTALMTYFGHGSPNVWSMERMWFGGDHYNSDNQHLRDAGHPAFLLNLTCNAGAIDYPMPPWNVNIVEDAMRTPGGAAIGSFVPTGPGAADAHGAMAKSFLRGVFEHGGRRLGEIGALAKAGYLSGKHPRHLALMYLLLGDPALELGLPASIRTFDAGGEVLRPGQWIDRKIVGVVPESGKFIVSLESGDGEAIWTGAAETYSEGRIPVRANLDPKLALGPKRLRVYAWNESEGDVAASASFELRNPEAEIAKIDVMKLTEPSARVSVEIGNSENAGPTTGTLELRRAGSAEGTAIQAVAFSVPPEGKTVVGLEIPRTAGAKRPEGFEVSLKGLKEPMSPEKARTPERQFALPAADGKPKWVKELGGRSWNEGEKAFGIHGVVSGTEKGVWQAGINAVDGELLTTGTLSVEAQGAGVATGDLRLELTGETASRARTGSLWFAAAEGGEIADQLQVADLPVAGAHLRIGKDSLKIEPEKPTEGHTILAHVTIENAGDEASHAAALTLFDKPPTPGLAPAYNHLKIPRLTVPPLGPGRSIPMTLRWDPVKNAGEQSLWAQLEPHPLDGNSTPEELLAQGKVRVRTKEKLGYGRIWPAANELDRRRRRMFLKAEVKNEGETEAKNVTVFFFLGNQGDTSRVIHESLVKELPGNSKQTVIHEWDYGTDPRFKEAPETLRFWVMIMQKASGQRISSAATEGLEK